MSTIKEKLIVVLSGEIASGKSSLADSFEKEFGFEVLRTKQALIEYGNRQPKSKPDQRLDLQKLGEKLDKDTNGMWIVRFFQSKINELQKVIIDSIRIEEQIIIIIMLPSFRFADFIVFILLSFI